MSTIPHFCDLFVRKGTLASKSAQMYTTFLRSVRETPCAKVGGHRLADDVPFIRPHCDGEDEARPGLKPAGRGALQSYSVPAKDTASPVGRSGCGEPGRHGIGWWNSISGWRGVAGGCHGRVPATATTLPEALERLFLVGSCRADTHAVRVAVSCDVRLDLLI